MAGPDPAIRCGGFDQDARGEPGHDESGMHGIQQRRVHPNSLSRCSSPFVHVMFLRFTGRAPTPMIRFGHHRRYSPERNWEPLSDTEWAVLAPFLFRAAEAEMQTRREAAIEAAQHPDAPPFRDRRPAGRPVRDPRAAARRHLLARRPHPARPRAPALGRPPARVRQARHRFPPVPPLGQGRASGPSSSGARRPRPPRHHHPPPPGELDLPHLPPRLALARRARHGARPAPRLPFGAPRPLLAAARPRFVRTGLFQAPRRHAPRPRAWLARPPEGLPAQLQEAAGHRRRPTIHPALPGAAMNRLPARPFPRPDAAPCRVPAPAARPRAPPRPAMEAPLSEAVGHPRPRRRPIALAVAARV